MKLRFLGQSYFKPHNYLLPANTGKSINPVPEQNYTVLRPVKNFKADWGVRKYRGVNYVELRFFAQY